MQAVYFHNDFTNLVNFEYGRGYVNIGKAESRGVELAAEGRLSAGLSLNAAYTRSETRDKISGLPLLRRPKDQLTAMLNWGLIEKWTLNLAFIQVGRREDMDYSLLSGTRVVLPAYRLFNATVTFDLGPRVQVFGRFDNIFNARYETIKGYGAPGFGAYGGIRISII